MKEKRKIRKKLKKKKIKTSNFTSIEKRKINYVKITFPRAIPKGYLFSLEKKKKKSSIITTLL